MNNGLYSCLLGLSKFNIRAIGVYEMMDREDLAQEGKGSDDAILDVLFRELRTCNLCGVVGVALDVEFNLLY